MANVSNRDEFGDNEVIIDDDASVADEAEDDFVLPPPKRQHAVWLLPLNMGSCNGCDQQIAAMLAPRYELARRGISFASSPRHANIILLTGTLTKRSLEPVRRILAQIPDPHALIAVGDCVLNGSVFAGSDEIVPNAADLLAVNVEIAGNPPTPSQIVLAIEEAARLLDNAESGIAPAELVDDEETDVLTEDEVEEEVSR